MTGKDMRGELREGFRVHAVAFSDFSSSDMNVANITRNITL